MACKAGTLSRYAWILILGATLAACDEAAPTSSTVSIVSVSPSTGSIVASRGTPPGVFLDRTANKLAVSIDVQTIREHPFAQLYVFLLTSDPASYCGQNLPDMPQWQPLRPSPPQRVTITGFQVSRVPCDVVGVRAMLHTRIGGALFPPPPDQTVAEATLPVSLRILPAP
jgi:hypothetical protein